MIKRVKDKKMTDKRRLGGPLPLSFIFYPLSLFLFAALSISVSGCVFWHNFSTYFNTIYIAQTHLDAYEMQQKAIAPVNPNGAIAVINHHWFDEEYEVRQRALHEGDPDPVVPIFSQSLSETKQIENVHLDSAIILGSKVLADKKGSKYKEDALYIVGKAQFYKNDFVGSQRKFLELLHNFPDTKFRTEAQVLLARSLLANRQLDTAQSELEGALSSGAKGEDKRGLSEVHQAYAEYAYARSHDSLAAVANELQKAEDGLSGEELARLAYKEGEIYYLNSDWPNAERAFRIVYESSKDDWLIGEGHVAHALALRGEEKFDEARTELQMVVTRKKFGGSYAAARYELAYTNDLAARKAVGGDLKSSDFRTKYFPSLREAYYSIDTSYKNSSAMMISRAKFREAELYRSMGEYDSAQRMAAGLIGTKDFSSSAMNEYVSQQASSFASFARWRVELTRVDSIEQSVKPKPGSNAEIARSNPDSIRHDSDSAMLHVQALREVLGARWKPQLPVTLTKEDSLRLIQVEARLQHEHDKIPRFAITDTVKFIDSLHYLAVNAHYQLGRAYEAFEEIPHAREEYRSALAYHFVISDTAKTAIRAQALYAWMQLESREKNQAVADSLLNVLLSHYGQTIFAEQARVLYASNSRNTPGEVAYRDAYKILRDQGLDAAKAPLITVALDHKQEDVAPRSLFAIGETYEEQEHYDSAVVYYRRVLNDYPYSSYAMSLRPRFADVASGLPHAPPQPLDPTKQPGEEQQRQQAEQMRQAREEELRKRAQQAAPGVPPIESGSQPVNVGNQNSNMPPALPPSSPFQVNHPNHK
jgi:tetratricopeptide (TPR) repeat protein